MLITTDTKPSNAFRVEHKSKLCIHTLNKKRLTLDAICVWCVRHGLINLEARNRHRLRSPPHGLHESGAALFRLLIIASSSAVHDRDTRQIYQQREHQPTHNPHAEELN